MATKSPSAFRTISEVAETLDLPQHVLRFWETKFPSIKPMKRGGGRRYYRPEDLELLRRIRNLLYDEGYTIKGVQKLLKSHGVKGLVNTQSEPEKPIATSLGNMDENPAAAAGRKSQTTLIGEAIGELQRVKELLQAVKSA